MRRTKDSYFRPRGRAWRPADDALLRKVYGTMSVAAVAELMERSFSSVKTRAHKLGLQYHIYRRYDNLTATGEPLPGLPGSEERIAAMAERVENGVRIW